LKNDSPHQIFEYNKKDSESYVEALKKKMKIEIISINDEEIVFDFIGVDVSIANALRRILLSEVSTMAIEHVYVWINSSLLHDEVLAHRIGLIPIKADPAAFDAFTSAEDEPTDSNTLVFKLDVKYERPVGLEDEVGYTRDGRPQPRPPTMTVYSGRLEWVPQGTQDEHFTEIKPVYEDIILAKLRPGQQITLEAHARKGNGRNHAKYSPVATAAYRLLPRIIFNREVIDDEATQLIKTCPMKVFDIEDLGTKHIAKVARPRNCTMCRECIREEGNEDRIRLERVADHFIFQVESVGIMPAQRIVKEAIHVLKEKCHELLVEIEQCQKDDAQMET